MRLRDVQTPVNFIVHSLREVNTRIKEGRYFFTDIRREGIVLYELEPEPLAQPGTPNPDDAYRVAKEYFDDRLPHAQSFTEGAEFYLGKGRFKEGAFCYTKRSSKPIQLFCWSPRITHLPRTI